MRNKLKSLLTASMFVVAAVAYAEEKKELVIGGGPVAEVPQFAVALDRGLFDEKGLDVKVIPFASGREGFEALIGGQLDLVIMAEFPAVVGAMREQPFGVVALISRYKGTRIITTGDEAPASAADLAGKRLGVTVGTNTHYMVERELEKAGVTAEIVNVGPPDLVPALVRGDIDAAAPFPSFYAGAKRTLGDDYQELRVSSYGTNFVLAATRELIDKDPEAIASLLAAMIEAEETIDADTAAAQETVAKVAGRAQPLEDIQANWPDYEYRLVLDQDFIDLMSDEGEWITGLGLIKGVEPTEQLFRSIVADGPLAKADAERVTLD